MTRPAKHHLVSVSPLPDHREALAPADPQLCSMATARRRYFNEDLSVSMLRKMGRTGKLRIVKIGRRTMIEVSSILEAIERGRGGGQ